MTDREMPVQYSSRIRAFYILFLVMFAFSAVLAIAQSVDKSRNDYLYARKLFEEGYYDLAAEQLERVLRDNPEIQNADEVQFLLGEAWLNSGELKKARAAFLKLAFEFPGSPLAAQALFYNASALESSGQISDAAQAFQRLQEFYPKSQFATRALYKALTIYAAQKDNNQVELLIDRLINKYPQSVSADAARLYKAKLLRHSGHQHTARLYLERIAARSLSDSIATRAYLLLGEIQQDSWEFDAAAESWKAAIERNVSHLEHEARVKLADLFIYRGIPKQALSILEPIINAKRGDDYYEDALVKTGDAYYLTGNLQRTIEYYRQSNSVEARLKLAWVYEQLNDPQTAIEVYDQVFDEVMDSLAFPLLRLTSLATATGNEKAEKYWETLLSRSNIKSPDGVLYYDAMKFYANKSDSNRFQRIDSLRARLKEDYPRSNYLDDACFTSAIVAEQVGKYAAARDILNEILEQYPASDYATRAEHYIAFLNRCRIRTADLFEKMAMLSSKPREMNNLTEWAMNWGDFYLDEFKDPVKAIDQYDYILTDTTAGDEDFTEAILKSTDAYIRLAEIALVEADTVAFQMFADTVKTRLISFRQSKLYSIRHFAPLEMRFVDLLLLSGQLNEQTISDVRTAINSLVHDLAYEELDKSWLARALYELSQYEVAEIISGDTLYSRIVSISERNLQPDSHADIQYFLMRYLEESEEQASLRDTSLGYSDEIFSKAKYISSNHPHTPAGAKTLMWLVDQDTLDIGERLIYLSRYKKNYYYLIDPVTYYRKGTLLEGLAGHPYETWISSHAADSLARWDYPDFNILDIIDEASVYKEGNAYFAQGQLQKSALVFRRLLNHFPKGKFAADAHLAMGEIFTVWANFPDALAYLDTLKNRFPYSTAAFLGEKLEPRLEFLMGNYSKSEQLFTSLIEKSENLDSLYVYETRKTVCLYRQNKLNEARNSAREIYKRFDEDVRDMDHVKGLFYLEKGLSLDRTGQHDDARDQYRTIIENFTTTEWVDNAAFYIGLSLVKQKQKDRAVEYFKTFIENYSASEFRFQAMTELSNLYVKDENYSEAAKLLKATWQDSSASANWKSVFEMLVDIYRQMRFFDAAISLNREYLERFPQAPDALNRRMEIAQLHLQIGNWDQAIRQYKPLLEYANAEAEAEIQYYIGEAYQQKGDYRSAILEFMKVPILGRKTKLDWGVTAIYQTGRCYEALEDYEGAARMYREIIKQRGVTSNFGRAAQKALDELKGKGLIE